MLEIKIFVSIVPFFKRNFSCVAFKNIFNHDPVYEEHFTLQCSSHTHPVYVYI